MEICKLDSHHPDWIDQAAALIVDAFPQAYPDQATGLAEISSCLEAERIALVAVVPGPGGSMTVAGFIGAIPQYGSTGWELHPLVVSRSFRRQGIGTALVRHLEAAVVAREGITMYLGSDDEFGQTSLAGCDLYDRLWERVGGIEDRGGHPFAFYQTLGYQIVGVIPDANGFGKPDILMARRLREPPGGFRAGATPCAAHE